MEFTKERFAYTERYVREVFGKQDAHLASLMDEAVAAGLPPIAVSPDVGRLLKLLVGCTRGRLVVELGTLAGYSAIWLARGLASGGKLITVEIEEKHAQFAERQLARAGVADRVQVRRGAALDVLQALSEELAPGSVDAFFFDAVKREYLDYWRLAKPLLAPGGFLIADNVLGASYWIDMEGHPDRDAIDGFNRTVADDDDVETTCVPLREGVLVARKT
jgi:predicted O-methyltransferase YrrM